MPSSKLSVGKRVEHVAIGSGIVIASFAALTWALSTDAQAAQIEQTGQTGQTGFAPSAPSTLVAIGVSDAGAAFPADLSAPATAVVAKPKPKPKPKDPSRLKSGWYTPVAKYSMTARFGIPGSWSSGYHTGLDRATNQGRNVRAATSGKVTSAEYEGAYGNLVKIKIGPKTELWMAHLDAVKVSKGDRVKAGQAIGTVGMTGNTSGAHCHFEVRVNDKPKNPEDFLWPDSKSVRKLR
jgi:murein DD-endopeptidase MepM/ murein hydrolase activator NlpD